MSINCLTLRWFESIIHPLHKKYDINLPDNNRGISLLNTSSKIYSYILTQWVEENSVIHEAQAGFRRNYSTVDHIFTLLTLVQKQLLNYGKLYAAFIDLKKAFDLAIDGTFGKFYVRMGLEEERIEHL